MSFHVSSSSSLQGLIYSLLFYSICIILLLLIIIFARSPQDRANIYFAVLRLLFPPEFQQVTMAELPLHRSNIINTCRVHNLTSIVFMVKIQPIITTMIYSSASKCINPVGSLCFDVMFDIADFTKALLKSGFSSSA
jgi:hypothetical protein